MLFYWSSSKRLTHPPTTSFAIFSHICAQNGVTMEMLGGKEMGVGYDQQ